MGKVKQKIKGFYEEHKLSIGYGLGCVVAVVAIGLRRRYEIAKIKATYNRLFPDGLTVGDLGKLGEKWAENDLIRVTKDTTVEFAEIFVDKFTD